MLVENYKNESIIEEAFRVLLFASDFQDGRGYIGCFRDNMLDGYGVCTWTNDTT
jgi:hypothetical protein